MTICASPCLLLHSILDASFRLTNQFAQSFLQPTTFYDHHPRHMSVLFRPHLTLSLSAAQLRSDPYSFQLLMLVFGCPGLPVDHPGLLQKHLLHALRATFSNSKLCHCGHFDGQIRGSHTYDCSCKSSHSSQYLQLHRSSSSTSTRLPLPKAGPW